MFTCAYSGPLWEPFISKVYDFVSKCLYDGHQYTLTYAQSGPYGNILFHMYIALFQNTLDQYMFTCAQSGLLW